MTLNDGPFDLSSATARPEDTPNPDLLGEDGRLSSAGGGTVGPTSGDLRPYWPPGAEPKMLGMEFGVVLTTVILFALMLAIVAGLIAALVLMHAAETRSPQEW